MALPSVALPGTLLGPAAKYLPGPGTHIHEASVYASIAGPVVSSAPRPPPTSTSTSAAKPSAKAKALPLLSISRNKDVADSAIPGLSGAVGSGNVLPEVDSTVLARVTRLGIRLATVDILVVGDAVCTSSFQGVIRREDIRATEKDKVKIEDSFRVGDLVRGVIISLGDQSNYYLSTARNELGVVLAESEAGNTMVPVSWREFVDPRTGKRESRKVAKPF